MSKQARAFVEVLGPFRLLVNIEVANGDHHELVATDPVEAKQVLADFCRVNDLMIPPRDLDVAPEARRINICGREYPVNWSIEDPRRWRIPPTGPVR